jgi:hypothetical protein
LNAAWDDDQVSDGPSDSFLVSITSARFGFIGFASNLQGSIE